MTTCEENKTKNKNKHIKNNTKNVNINVRDSLTSWHKITPEGLACS